MPRRTLILVIAAATLVASFGAGFAIAGGNSKDYAIYTGDCWVGAKEASCTVGDLGFGVSDAVAWTDASGVGRGGTNDPGEWPTCLPQLSETKGVRFAGAMLPLGPNALGATIVWVDCRGR